MLLSLLSPAARKEETRPPLMITSPHTLLLSPVHIGGTYTILPQIGCKEEVQKGYRIRTLHSRALPQLKCQYREVHNLPFRLTVDADRSLAKEWGNTSTVTRDDGSEAVRYVRGQYVIDEEGKIAVVESPVQAPQSLRLALEGLGLDSADA